MTSLRFVFFHMLWKQRGVRGRLSGKRYGDSTRKNGKLSAEGPRVLEYLRVRNIIIIAYLSRDVN